MKSIALKTLAEIEELQKLGLIERHLETFLDGTRELSFYQLRRPDNTWLDESSKLIRTDILMSRKDFKAWEIEYHLETMNIIETRSYEILNEIRNA